MLLYYTDLAETVFPNVYFVIVHLLLYFACVVHSMIPITDRQLVRVLKALLIYNTVTLKLYTSAVKQHWDTIKNMKIVDYLVCMTQYMCSFKNHEQLLLATVLCSINTTFVQWLTKIRATAQMHCVEWRGNSSCKNSVCLHCTHNHRHTLISSSIGPLALIQYVHRLSWVSIYNHA